jgi:hypothetical protein
VIFEINIFTMNIYIMSIVALKRKTAAKYNNMSVGEPQFSINGGYRNQGWVGQTSLSRSIPKTPMRNGAPQGHGGCCGEFKKKIIVPPVTSTNDNTVIKGSVLSTPGMLDTKYRWVRRPAAVDDGKLVSVKPDDNHNLNSQTDYITRKTKKAINEANTKDGNDLPCTKKQVEPFICGTKCGIFKHRWNTPHGNNIDKTTKRVGPLDSSEYIANISDKCAPTDVEFQDKLNNKSTSTPFGC